MYPVRLGFAFRFYPKLGSDALWLSFLASMVVTALMGVVLYLQGGWCEGKVLPPKKAVQQSEKYRAQGRCSLSCSDIVPITSWERSEDQDTTTHARS